MSNKKKKKRRKKIVYRDIQLNIMPFIDVFSLLNTFLLMSAVFLSVGIIEVQIPFLTSAPPEKQDEKFCDVKVDMEKEKIEVFGLKRVLQDLVTGLRGMFSLMRRLRLTVQERQVVTVIEAAAERVSALSSADELSPP